MNFQIPDNKLLELRNVLNRAMNTWEPAHWPVWLREWDKQVDAALAPVEPGLHVFHDRRDGLQHCKVCNGAEASLPLQCPGARMTSEQEEAVLSGEMDYRDGRWVRLNRELVSVFGSLTG